MSGNIISGSAGNYQLRKVEGHWYLILNPKAGGGKSERHWDKISALLNREEIRFERHDTHSPGHAVTLARQAIHMGFRKIIAVGGDGTANEVANGILDQNEIPSTDITLAQIPVGTGNDWGRTIGIPSDYSASIRMIRQGKTFIQDAGIVHYQHNRESFHRWFVNIAGMGYDASVGEYVDGLKRKGRSGAILYMYGLVSRLFSFKAMECHYGTEKPEFEKSIFSLAVGICRFNGGGMMQCPQAIPDDGLLDMTVIHQISKFKVIRNLKNLFDGTFTREPEVAQFKADSFVVNPKGAMPIETDGEYLGRGPAQFGIREKCLKVIVK